MTTKQRHLPKRFDSVPTAPAGTHYLILGLDFWGKGPSLEEAARNAKRAGGRLGQDRLIIYAVAPEVWVDGEGCICTPPKNAIGEPIPTGTGYRFETEGEAIPGDPPLELTRLA